MGHKKSMSSRSDKIPHSTVEGTCLFRRPDDSGRVKYGVFVRPCIISCPVYITSPIRPYDLRHAYATYSIRSGADIKTSAEIMGHENARMILEVYEHVDWAQKVRAIEGMPDFFALAPKAVRNPIHERRPRKREIDEPGAKYCVRNTVPALNDRKHLVHSEIKNQYGNPADKDADHKRNAKTQNPCGPECRSQKERGHKYELSQQTEQKKLKEEIHKPPPFVAKPEYRAEKQHDRTQPRKDSTHDNLHDGASQWDAPG